MVNIAFLTWPVVSAFVFRALDLRLAIAVTLIGGYLLLPPSVSIDPPLLPPIEKNTVAAISALVLAALFAAGASGEDRGLPGWLPRNRVALLLICLLVAGAFLTVQTNGDRISTGSRVLPALRLYDAFSIIQGILVALVPFFLGRKFFADSEQHRVLLIVICVAGVGYSFLALYEVRMSPQLNRYLYGYFPHSWVQHLRADGFRPVVFLRHGLELGIFICCAMLAAAACYRARVTANSWRFLAAALWLFMTLFLAKTLGAFLIAVVMLPLVLLLNVRLQLLAAGALGAIIMLYPMLRGADLVPTDSLVSFAESIDAQRAGSLQFRFDNEDILLERANERPLFGWGGYSRGRVFDENGRDISTTDGWWVIVAGQGGWIRYIGECGLLTLSIIFLAFRSRTLNVSLVTSGLSLVLAANLVDLLPNAGLTPITWLMAGALYGRLEVAAAPYRERQKGNARHFPVQALKASSGSLAANENSADQRSAVSSYTRQTVRHERRDSTRPRALRK